MILAKVVGTVVSTAKDPNLTGRVLLVCHPLTIAERGEVCLEQGGQSLVAVDLVGALEGSVVVINTGSAAKEMSGSKVDAVAVGIVDYAIIRGRRVTPEM